MTGCGHWNKTVMVLDENGAKRCHVFYDGEYQETYVADANDADMEIEVWCDDCEELFKFDRDDIPEWVVEALQAAAQGEEDVLGA